MVRRARFVEIGVLHQCSARWGGRIAYSVEGPGEQGRQPRPGVRLGRRPVSRARLWRNRSSTDRIDAGGGRRRSPRPRCTVVLGSELLVADGSAHLFRSLNFSGANLLTLFLYAALTG